MSNTNVIFIEISGPVQSGKSAVLASIKRMLEQHGYCVAVPGREARHNPPKAIEDAPRHELPKPDVTVFALTECVSAISKITSREQK